jgi:TolB-like protein/Tfp pilus assembly protein PilF
LTDTPTERAAESTWTRLRRRKVVQWGIVYVAAAWGFLQGLEYVSEAFGWPTQLRQIALLALLIGLPVVLVLAWYHGDRGQQRITTPEFAILVLLLLLGGGAFWYYQRASDLGENLSATASAVQTAASPGIKDARPSVAVLPFENRSRLEDDAFFVDGIHDDILTQLSKVSALRVISRTSVEQFRETKLSMKAIANQLGVTRILEGGVQRAGDRVRINVQLIDAATDAHLWADQYDRELTAANIFAIQSEVASSIADALRATLTPSERTTVNAVPTQNLAAWEAYHLGRQAMSRRTVEGLADAVGQFEKAIQLDPAFALAYVALADALTLQVDYGGTERDSATDRASKLVTRALELQPGLTEAAVSAAMIAWTSFDYLLAESDFKRAIELNPNSVEANHWYSNLLSDDLGRRREAEIYARRAAQLDPRSGIVRVNLGGTLQNLGRFDEAIAEFGRAIEIQPSQPNGYVFIGLLEAYALGRVDRAVPWIQRAAELDPTSGNAPAWLTTMYLDLGDQAEAERWLAQAIRDEADRAEPKLVSCKVALLAGRPALAVEHAKDALEMLPKSPEMLQVLRDDDLRKGKYAQARARYARPYPELLEAVPTVNSSNVAAAIDLALVLKMSGDDAGATRLLALSEAAIQDMPRLGTNGFGIADVYIYALRGEKRKALLALQTAVRAGWHGPWPFWRLARDHDENLSSIRNEPEFKAVFADIERDMAKQRAALAARPKDAPLELKATGA